MNKRVKLCLALFLAFAVIVQYSFSPQAMIAYGEDGDTVTATEASDQTEPTQATTAPKPAPEPSTSSDSSGSSGSSDSSDATEPTESTEASDDSDGASDDANTDAEDPTTVEEETTVEDEEVEYPEVSFTKSADGMTVKIHAPEGALPEGADVKVVAVPSGSIENAVEDLIENSEVVKAVDITFYDKDGKAIEPKKNVSVSMFSSAFRGLDSPSVVHIKDNGTAERADNGSVNGSTASFKSADFSIYAVVETGNDARAKVVFMSGGSEVAHMYVKADDNWAQVIYDPGAGELSDGVYFKGWTTEEAYTTKTAPKTIAGVRSDIEALDWSRVKDADSEGGTVITYYAMLFKSYKVAYFDENNVSLGEEEVSYRADATSDEQAYTVNMAYTPSDNIHNFEGWKVQKGGSNIVGYSEGKVYENTAEIEIKGNVEFSVNAPEGHWLVFDENGKGAKYNAPKFIHSGEVTEKPCPDSEMTRHGYQFGGWYTDAACTDGNEFTFGNTISDYTTIYAKWTPRATANYTVIIWKERASDTYADNATNKNYDFYKAYTLSGNVNSSISAVSSSNTTTTDINGTYNDYRVRAGSVNEVVSIEGYHASSNDQSGKVVKPEGDTIVNVYYDRHVVRYTFYYPGRVSGWMFPSAEWDEYDTQTGLYGESLKWPEDTSIFWYEDYTLNNYNWTLNPFGSRMTYKSAFIPMGTNMDVKYYGFTGEGNGSVRFYTQDIEGGDNYTQAQEVKVSIGNAGGSFSINDKFTGFKAYQYRTTYHDRWGNVHWTDWANVGTYDPSTGVYGDAVSFNPELEIRYNRLFADINFMDGSYFDGSGHPISEDNRGQLHAPVTYAFESDLTAYNKGGDNYFEPEASGAYVFAGWYADASCSVEYNFTTMPATGVTVYAKWIQQQYRVYMHPNYPEGASGDIDWGSSSQSLCFRLNPGQKISEPTGKLNGYKFVGWFTDSGCSNVFSGKTYPLNDSNVKETYNWDVDKTEYDINGNALPAPNEDKTQNRFWIKKKFQIYGQWRATTEGAKGIGVTYDPGAGTNPPTDTNTYVDNAVASAGAASTPNASGKQFGYWVLQTWSTEENKYVDTTTKLYPGDLFNVLKKNAKVEDIANPEEGKDTKKYTVQLRAEYIDSEKPTPTHIPWFKNDGTKAFHIDNNDSIDDSDLNINEGVSIQTPPSRPGYTFLGWAKVDMANDLSAVKAWEANSGNWTQNSVSPYLYYANGGFHLGSVSGNVVTQVAADEDTPYQAMFGVWEENKVTINYAVASDSTGYGSVSRETETINAASGTAQGSTATGTGAYTLDYWTCDDGTDPISTDTTFVPSKKDGAYEAHTYYAHFSCKEANVTVHHYLKGTTTSVAEDVTSTETVGSEYTAQPVAKYQEKNLTVDSYNPSQKITVSADGNEITIYYTLPLTITAKTDSKTYDGTPLTGEYTVTGALATDEEKIEKALGTAPSITNVSESPREYQATTTDVPGYYVITNEKGTLTINPLAVTVTITGNSNSSLYNGADQSVEGYTFKSSSALVKEADLTTKPSSTKTTATGKDNGTYRMTMTADDFGIDNGNFTVTFNVTPGTLTINKRNVTITTPSDTKVYDGTALTNHNYTISGDGFVERETPSIVVTGSQTEVGRSYNTFTYSFDGITGSALDEIFKASAVEDNYIIHPAYGILTVTAVPGPTPPTPTPTPGGGGGGPAAAPAAPVAANATVVDNPVPTTIDEPAPPKAVNAYWALINLLCAIATALLSLIMLIRYFGKRKDEEDVLDPATGERVIRDVEEQRGGLARIASLVPAIGGIIAFLLTEDMSLPMAMVDKWTVLMIVILAIQAGVGIVAKLRDEKDDEDEEAMA